MRLPRPAAVLVASDGVRHVLADKLTLGRATEMDLQLMSPRVARLHLELVRTFSGTWVARDVGSSNGSLLNGVRLASSLLRSGDVLEVDGNRFVFECEPFAPPAIDEEVLRVVSAPDVEAALAVWLDGLIERGDPIGLALREGPPKFDGELEAAVRRGELELGWQRHLVRELRVRGPSNTQALRELLDHPASRFISRLTLPTFSALLGLEGAPLTALEELRVGPFFLPERAEDAERELASVVFTTAPRLRLREVESFGEAWLELASGSRQVLARDRATLIGASELTFDGDWRIAVTAGTNSLRWNGRPVHSARLAPGDQLSSRGVAFTFLAARG